MKENSEVKVRGICDRRLLGLTPEALANHKECGLWDPRECKVHSKVLKAEQRAALERQWDSVTTH